MKKFALAAILAGTTGLGVAGYAAAWPHGGKGMVEKFDTDGDGSITQEEVEAYKAERFAEADANDDGSLTMEEIENFREAERARMMEQHKQRMFDRQDEDGDGTISLDEFDQGSGKIFERVDADDDGVITEDEIEAMKDKRGKRGWHHRSDEAPE